VMLQSNGSLLDDGNQSVDGSRKRVAREFLDESEKRQRENTKQDIMASIQTLEGTVASMYATIESLKAKVQSLL
jgi:hypothetical protein